jgi:hypothetical protein
MLCANWLGVVTGVEHHVDLNKSDLEAAWAYYHQQPEEIELVMREGEEA